MGYEAIREQTLARQKQLGLVPADTAVPPINPIGTPQTRKGPQGQPFPELDYTRPWDSLEENEKRLFCRMAEVYAGFLAHADFHIGRLLDDLEASRELENTMIVLVSDNGASGEGGPNGSVNEMKFAAGWGNFNEDEWELYHTDVDRAELNNLAAEQPDKLRELVNIWFSEAGANGAFPLDDRTPVEILMEPRPQLAAPRDRYVYYPGNSPVPEWQAVNTKNRSFVIGALVDIPGPGAEGVIFAHGTRFGGHTLYVKDNRLHYVNNFVGADEQMIVATEDLPSGEKLILSASFDKEGNERTCAKAR